LAQLKTFGTTDFTDYTDLNLAKNGHEFTRTGTDKQRLSMQPNILQKLTHPSKFP
jgi:hypothetical protein